MATDRKAEVTWHGDLMSGSGRIDSVTSGAIGGSTWCPARVISRADLSSTSVPETPSASCARRRWNTSCDSSTGTVVGPIERTFVADEA